MRCNTLFSRLNARESNELEVKASSLCTTEAAVNQQSCMQQDHKYGPDLRQMQLSIAATGEVKLITHGIFLVRWQHS